jgi:hypothetical protein
MADTTNMAVERRPTFRITHLHGVTPAAANHTYIHTSHYNMADTTTLPTYTKNFSSIVLIPTMPYSGCSGFNWLL